MCTVDKALEQGHSQEGVETNDKADIEALSQDVLGSSAIGVGVVMGMGKEDDGVVVVLRLWWTRLQPLDSSSSRMIFLHWESGARSRVWLMAKEMRGK